MIQLFHVSKIYSGSTPALSDLTLQIPKGEFVFVTGPSGAGKSTLLKLVLGVERTTQGQILVDGKNLTRMSSREMALLRRRIGFVFQDFKLLPRRTVLENVSLALHVQGVPPRKAQQRAFQALRSVGLSDKRDQKPLRLSGGEQQRVAIARALVSDPILVLADEPTGNLDWSLSREIMDQFVNMQEQGTTVMVATHNEELVNHYGKRRIMLERGSLAGP
ncbi:MAG: cell division ATP-binding protein FtsE [bacterium]